MKPPSTARTAGRSDWAERRFRRQPFILLSFSSSEKPQKRRKRSHTNVSNTLVARPSTPPAQTPQRSFQGAAAGGTHATPAPNRAHSGSHAETRGVLDGGAITTLGVCCVVRNLCARSGQKSILCHLCMDRGNVGEKQRAFGTETRTVRVSVPRRRGPAGSRCSTAVSCATPVSFAVRYHCDEGQGGKFVNVTVVILFVV